MKNKVAQYTELDRHMRAKELNKSPWAWGPTYREQKQLEFVPSDYDPKTRIDKNYQQRRKWEEEIEKAHEAEMDEIYEPREAYNFKFPELTPEQVRWSPLTEEQQQEYTTKDLQEQNRWKKYKETGQWERLGPDDHSYHAPWGQERDRLDKGVSQFQEIYDRNLLNPEEAKKQVLQEYNKLIAVSKTFDEYYREANELASQIPELDYSQSYIKFFENFPKYVMDVISSEIGNLFGSAKYYRRHGWNAPAEFDRWEKDLANILQNFNVFNITPVNIQWIKSQIHHVIDYMQKIIDEYVKRKKILKQLPKILEAGTREILADNDYKSFLLWMDKYFPNDKHTFIKELVDSLSERFRDGQTLSLHDLKIVKTYKAIYHKAQKTAHSALMEKLHNNAREQVKDFIKDEIAQRLVKKVSKLEEYIAYVYEAYNPNVPTESELDKDRIRVLFKYINKEYSINISHILQFVNTVIDTRGPMNLSAYPSERDARTKEPPQIKQDYLLDFLNCLRKFAQSNSTIKRLNGRLLDRLATVFYSNFENRVEFMNTPKLEEVTEQHLDNFLTDSIRQLIVVCLPRFSDKTETYVDRPYEDERRGQLEYSNFVEIGQLIRTAGTFSMQAFADRIVQKMPGIPQDFAAHLIKYVFKNFGDSQKAETTRTIHNNIIATISSLGTAGSQLASEVFIEMLHRNNKFNRDSFTSTFIAYFQSIFNIVTKIISDLRMARGYAKKDGISDTTIKRIILESTSTFENLQRDINNINDMVTFLHNSASHLSDKDLIKLISNPNFRQFHKLDISKKLLKAYAKIKNLGGPEGIKQKYGALIEHLKKEKHLSRAFWGNIKLVMQVFNFNKLIIPGSPLFDKVLNASITVESDLETIQDSGALFELIKKAQPKDRRLFDLDWGINPDLRFRVLRDKDPRHLRVGIETQCCQRLGGAAENVVKDSFINPIAGVVILERRYEGQWQLLAQSYFNYVPDQNGYILDNVETNEKAVAQSGLNLEGLYAALARHMKEQYKVRYFLAGKRYSEIDNDIFKDHSLPSDPRTFAHPVGHQTDFSAKDHTNLLEPKFALQAVFPDYKKHFRDPEFEEKKKKALDLQISDYLLALGF